MAEDRKKESSKEKERVAKSGSDKSKAAKVVTLRNRFFFMMYRYSSLVFITSLVSFLFSIGFLIFFARQPVPPQYIPINEDGTYIKLDPLSTCKKDADVQKFALSAIKKLYKYDYINYADQLQEAAAYFTAPGWNKYLEEYSRSNTLLAVKENKWIVSVVPLSVPIINKTWMDNGVCTWEIKTPLSITYVGASNSQNPKGDLYMRVVRQSVINNADGLGITQTVLADPKQ